MLKMVFDVESNGLHGVGFAVGWVVVDPDGNIISQGFEYAQPANPIPWVEDNVLTKLGEPTVSSYKEVRDAFWSAWMAAKNQGATLWADCGWPVEANFLSACIQDDLSREWDGPYPLHEIATCFNLVGLDPIEKHERLDDEVEHHPLGDARQSARLLTQCLNS